MDHPRLTVAADSCPGEGALAAAPACRGRVVDALTDRDAATVVVTHAGLVRTYAGRGAATLRAAGRFRARVRGHDERLADRARTDPLGAARAATGRAGGVGRIAAATGLSACAAGLDRGGATGYRDLFEPGVAPVGAVGRTRPAAPDDEPTAEWELETGSVARRYARADGWDRLHLRPASAALDATARRTLAAARDRLAAGVGERAPERAVAAAVASVADDDSPTDRLTAVLERHTRGLGLLTDLLAVPGVTDLWLTAPVRETPVRVATDGWRAETNVRLSAADARTLASRVRADSGGGLSRADPTADAAVDGVRVAAVGEPVSDGPAFALRRDGDADPWTLPRLVATGTLPARAAALLSLAVARGAAGLVAGPRGAGKTTVLGALLWALPQTVRTVIVEDTPELPVAELRERDRDVQRLAVDTGSNATFTPTDAVRTALRLGDGALVVGEVRGEEAQALYEAMRVGAAADAVLGTIHGTDAAAVRERVVSDLGVPRSAFAATEFVLSLSPDHRLSAIEEVRQTDDGVTFQPVFDTEGATGLLRRGDSELLAGLTATEESYADGLTALSARAERIERLAATGRTDPSVSLEP